MTVTAFDLASYQHLLSEAHPRVPQTEAENEVLIQMVRELQDKGYLSPEEQALTAVLLALIEKFEDEHYSTSKAKPAIMSIKTTITQLTGFFNSGQLIHSSGCKIAGMSGHTRRR